MSIAFAPEANHSSFAPEAAYHFDADAAFAHELASAPEPVQAQPVQPAVAPFGWYPDPAGTPLLRWWNGSVWTDRLEHARPELQVAAGYSTRELLAR